MKIAYLIVAYKNPKLIKMMIKKLSSDNCAFFIHIDKKCKICFDEFTSINAENVFFSTTRIPVYWGEYSMIEAELLLIKQALAAPDRYDRFVLLSGSDYPLKSKEYISSFFERNKSAEFISLIRMPAKGKPISRLNTYRAPSNKRLFSIFIRILAKIGIAQHEYRRYFGSMEPYAGSTWWALTRDACEFIIDFIENNQRFCHFFKKSYIVEEAFFHTILGNSVFKSRIQRNLMYDDWNDEGAHPEIIGVDHIKYFQENEKIVFTDMYGTGEMLFGRKVADDNMMIVKMIDEMIDAEAYRAPN